LYINRSETDYVGLFGSIDEEGYVRNVGVVDANVSGDWYVGGLVGENRGTVEMSYATGMVSGENIVGGLVGLSRGTVSNSYAAGDVNGDLNFVGGLVGENREGTVSSSYATGVVSGDNLYVGGLVGWNNEGTVLDSYATGDVSGGNRVGGLVGENLGPVKNSYATGATTGETRIGGLIGFNYHSTIEKSYATGDASGEENVGGLVGRNEIATVNNSYATGTVTRISDSTEEDFGGFVGINWEGKIINCYSTGSVEVGDGDELTENGFAGSVETGMEYEMIGNFWDTETSGQDETAGEATGLPTSEMMNRTTFTDEGWDFNEVWWMVQDETYPLLRWSPVFNTDSGIGFTTIQRGIDDPETSDGHTIYLADEHFSENVMLYKSISLIGSGVEETIIDAGGGDIGVGVMANNTVIRDFTVMNAADEPGSGIILLNPAEPLSLHQDGPPDTVPLVNCTVEDINSFDNNGGIILIEVSESLVANSSFSDNEMGIMLMGSDSNTIENNEITNNEEEGIFVMESDHNTIYDNIVSNNGGGIFLMESDGNEIESNEVTGNEEVGIILMESYENTIDNNDVSDNGEVGIGVVESDDNMISNNTASNNGMGGIFLGDSSYNTLEYNDVSNNGFVGIFLESEDEESRKNTLSSNTVVDNGEMGIALFETVQITLKNNEMENSGLVIMGSTLEAWNTHEIDTSNTLNDSPVRYLKDATDETVDTDAGQVILANCTGVTVEGMELNDGFGIILGFSEDNYISDNTLSDNLFGIGLIYSGQNHVIGNSFDENDMGIILDNSDGNHITDNTISNNHYGLEVHDSSDNNIHLNSFDENERGIILDNSDENHITDNTISNNDVGIEVINSYDNNIYLNSFIDNDEQAYDDGNNNWDAGNPAEEGEGGNYWSDYEGDDRGDGIGDVPYEIDGDGNQDNYPWMDPDMVLDSPFFEVEITNYDEEVNEGEEVTVEFTVENTGNIEGTQDIVFRVEGSEVDRKEDITIDAGDDDSGTFTWEATVEGEYELEVSSDDDSHSAIVTVKEEDIVEYELKINIDGEGTVEVDGEEWEDGDSDTFVAGTEVSLEAIPDEDRFFAQWEGDHTGIDNTTEITMDDNKEITAVFSEDEPVYYTLTMNIDGEGTVKVDGEEWGDGDSDTFVAGTEVSLEAIPDEDMSFSNWEGDVPEGEGEQETIDITMDENKTITANFIEGYEVNVGPVVDYAGDPVEGATVELSWGGSETTTTDSDGMAVFTLNFDPSDIEFTYTITHDDLDEPVTDIFEGADSGEIKVDIGEAPPDDDDEDEEEDEPSETGFLSDYWWILPIIIIAAVVVLVLAMKMGKKGESTTQPIPGEQEHQPPYEEPPQEQQPEQPPEQQPGPEESTEEMKSEEFDEEFEEEF